MRFLLQFLALVAQFLALVAVYVAGGQAVSAITGNPWLTLVLSLLVAVAALAVYRWVVGRTERREVTELATADAGRGFGRGLLIGFGMFAAVVLNMAFLGSFHLHGIGSVSGALGLLGVMAAAAAAEEAIFRGVLFRNIEKWLGTWLSLLLTGSLFGLLHLANPDATPWGAIAIAVEAGFMLAACYAATRSLWVPIGLHFGWNFALGGVFSMAVSGSGDSKGLLETSTSGSTLVTGGTFGPEGSLYTVGAGIALTVAFLVLAKVRGRIVPLRRRTAAPDATAATLIR